MMSLSAKFERMMMAATFAEAGEHETARDILKADERKDNRERPEIRKRPSKGVRPTPPRST